MKKNHEIDYQLHGNDMQYLEVELDPQETVVAEAGALMMKDSAIEMNAIFGDGSDASSGVFGKLKSAGRRMITGENMFMTSFTNTGMEKRQVCFASPYPGKIIPVDLSIHGGKIICQKDAYLASAKGVSIGVEFQRKLGAGFFGGEGFIMQKLEGDGLVFMHAGGSIGEYQLSAGQSFLIDTGCLVGMTGDVKYTVQMVKGLRSKMFAGEGLFLTKVEGPGTVWVQSLPFSRLANRIYEAAPQLGGKQVDEGSVAKGPFNLFGGN